MTPPSDWSMRGGLDEEEEKIEEDGKHFFYQKYYIPSCARFEDIPSTPMSADMMNTECPLFCPACIRKDKEDKVSERVCESQVVYCLYSQSILSQLRSSPGLANQDKRPTGKIVFSSIPTMHVFMYSWREDFVFIFLFLFLVRSLSTMLPTPLVIACISLLLLIASLSLRLLHVVSLKET